MAHRTMKLLAAVFVLLLGTSLGGAAFAQDQQCIPWKIKGWEKASEAFAKAEEAGAKDKQPYYHEAVRLYLAFAKEECDENDMKGATGAVNMAITRAQEAGWLSADK